jgi:hypothetical protein
MVLAWLHGIRLRKSPAQGTGRTTVRARRSRPRLECLEDRLAPAIFAYTVDRATDSADGAGMGLSGDLRYCVTKANGLMGMGDTATITFGAALSGSTITLAKALPDIGPRITNITGLGSANSTVRRDPMAATSFAVFQTTTDVSVTITGLTITKGNIAGVVNKGVMFLTDCVVTDNLASTGGGGITNQGTLTLSGTAVTMNRFPAAAGLGDGGGINNSGILVIGKSANGPSSITFNQAPSTGGGIYNPANASCSISDTAISGNTAKLGGGIYSVSNVPLVPALQIRRCSLYTNQATGLTGKGGAIYNGGTANISNTTIEGNTANKGAAIYASNAAAVKTTKLSSVTDANNKAITIPPPTAPPPGDTVSAGGGLYVEDGAEVDIVNSIIATNTSDSGLAPDVFGVVISLGHNLIGIIDGSSGWVNSDLLGAANAPLDPLLNPLGDYGGPTLSMTLQAGSPALQAGDPSQVDGDTDQRGFARIDPTTGLVDIGAVEMQPGELPAAARRHR